ncbi:MAG: hypothetical protein HFJ37_02900 [Clostridia bacterium]|nr:hypothetical protein [Clostridia bacterium]
MRDTKGITLISLVITIVVLLLLAGITIKTLTGESGLIENAKEAKDNTEIANEKEILEQATVKAMGNNRYGAITLESLEKAIHAILGEGKAKVIQDNGELVVKFLESKRYYKIDEDGKVSDAIVIVADEKVGDISKSGSCDGTKDKPYQIDCIEDLVAFSKAINNQEIKNNSYVLLMRALDFKSIFSYGDYETKYRYDETMDAYVKEETSNATLMELLNADKRIHSNWKFCR